jgi:hypothetical protein
VVDDEGARGPGDAQTGSRGTRRHTSHVRMMSARVRPRAARYCCHAVSPGRGRRGAGRSQRGPRTATAWWHPTSVLRASRRSRMPGTAAGRRCTA